MSFYEVQIRTDARTQMVDISRKVKAKIKESGCQEGHCLVYSPHTTGGITINENADPDVQTDMLKEFNKIVPFDDYYRHFEGNSAAHIKATITGFQAVIPIHNSELTLGTWQGIYFCEFDGPRQRKVYISLTKDNS